MEVVIDNLEKELLANGYDLRGIAEKYFFLYENSPDMQVSVDPADATIKNCNQTLVKKVGYSKEEIIGESIFFLYHPDCYSEARKAFRSFVETGRVINMELELRRKDGSKIPVLLDVEAVKDQNGKIICSNSCLRDISDVKRLQKQLMRANRDLENRNEELSQFAYIASHDLQEPLRSIMNFTNLLSKKYGSNASKEEQKSMKFILEASARMSQLIKSLLDHSRLGIHKKRTQIDCNAIMKAVKDDLFSSFSETKVHLEIENLPIIKGHETEFRLLLQNLLSNSLKFRKKGIPLQIRIFAKKKENHWLFGITDNGIGISMNDQKKIFMIFRRLHLTDEFEGTGIGLAHCKKIVALHGGKIWVDSKVDQGSTFCFTIPFQNL